MKLYVRIILILAISTIVLAILNKFYQKGHTKYFEHETERLNMLLGNEPNYDILLIGSSRMHVHYNTKIIDSVTQLKSYNFGVEGGNLLEINLWLQVYLQMHNPPKLAILDLPAFAFDIEHRPFFNPTIYYPYLDNSIIYETVSEYKKIGLYKYLPFLELMEVDDYNKFNALKGLTGGKEELASHFTYHGYADNGNAVLNPSQRVPHDTNTYKISEKGKNILQSLLDTCRKKNIKLIFAYSPEYFDTDYSNKEDFFKYVYDVSLKNNIPFFDYRKSAICSDSTLFANPGHLNSSGAAVFSNDIAHKMLQNIPLK